MEPYRHLQTGQDTITRAGIFGEDDMSALLIADKRVGIAIVSKPTSKSFSTTIIWSSSITTDSVFFQLFFTFFLCRFF